MSSRVNEIIGRRAVLISRAAAQREELARETAWFEGPIHMIDGIFRTGKRIKRYPRFLSALTAFLMATQWRHLAKLPKRLYQGFLLVNVLRNLRLSSRASS